MLKYPYTYIFIIIKWPSLLKINETITAKRLDILFDCSNRIGFKNYI